VSAQGSLGTATGILQSVQSHKISLPVIGSVSILTAGLGFGLIYFLFLRKRGGRTVTVTG